MSTLLPATDELIARATTSGTLQDLQRAVGQVHQAMAHASPEECNGALRRLSDQLPQMHPIPAAKVAMTCGALVETGGDPLLAGPTLLSLLPDALDGAMRYHELCAEKATAEGLI